MKILGAAMICSLVAIAPRSARAEITVCNVVDAKFTPAMVTSTAMERHEPSQIVVWVENTAGEYFETLFITAATGRFGLGNRPGRWDFNSGPMFPYGRRVSTFPIWSHRHHEGPIDGKFPRVVFQNVEVIDSVCLSQCTATKPLPECQVECADPKDCTTLMDNAFKLCGDNNLSHQEAQSSIEFHYCRPLLPNEPKWIQADAMTCASAPSGIRTDKGKFSLIDTSNYPPRVDLAHMPEDSAALDMYRAMNPFDAISQATPLPGAPYELSWPIPASLPRGDYVLWVEVSQAFDHNPTYSTGAYPSPPATGTQPIQYADYGLPYRGQPSVAYRVPFTIGMTEATTTTMDYVGYGDPTGEDGAIRPPDATITTDTPGSGASRLQLVSEDGQLYRLRVHARPEIDYALPGTADDLRVMDVTPTSATVRFIAPGDDGLVGKVIGYEIRYLVNREINEANFVEGTVALTTLTPVAPGGLQTFELSGLLPESDYDIGIRAIDDCHNVGSLAVVTLRTADRVAGSVDACFIATAAYGSVMASDVEMLRHFRDSMLQTTVLGELAVETYYTFGPAMAGVIGESDLLRSTTRAVLRPVIAWVRGLGL